MVLPAIVGTNSSTNPSRHRTHRRCQEDQSNRTNSSDHLLPIFDNSWATPENMGKISRRVIAPPTCLVDQWVHCIQSVWSKVGTMNNLNWTSLSLWGTKWRKGRSQRSSQSLLCNSGMSLNHLWHRLQRSGREANRRWLVGSPSTHYKLRVPGQIVPTLEEWWRTNCQRHGTTKDIWIDRREGYYSPQRGMRRTLESHYQKYERWV